MQRIQLFLLTLTIFSIFSCEEKECCVISQLELSGKFEHEIPGCENSGNAEINCIEWLEFINGSEVHILYGGIDIVERFTYSQEADQISLMGPATSSFMPVFIVKDQSTLERKDNGDIWKKK